MPKTVKILITSSFLSTLFFLAFYSAGAMIQSQKEINLSAYPYFGFAVNALIAGIMCLIYHKEEKSYLSVVTIILINFIIALINRHFTFNILISVLVIIAVFFTTKMIIIKRQNTRKNSIRKLRRNYEKLRKK